MAIAGVATFWLGRRWGASVWAAGIAAISYAFSGNVLAAHCNVVFLVGAAWLPWGVLLADRMLTERSWRASVGFGAILALIVLGGDPQLAYNAGLMAALYALLLWRRGDPDADSEPCGYAGSRPPWCCWPFRPSRADRWPRCKSCRPRRRLDSALAGFMIRRGRCTSWLHRTARKRPMTALAEKHAWYAGLLDASPSGHQRQIYQFSVGPCARWHMFGRSGAAWLFPTHRRWISGLPAEGRVWTPSLYMGVLPFLLAIATRSVRRAAGSGAMAVLDRAVERGNEYGDLWPRLVGTGDRRLARVVDPVGCGGRSRRAVLAGDCGVARLCVLSLSGQAAGRDWPGIEHAGRAGVGSGLATAERGVSAVVAGFVDGELDRRLRCIRVSAHVVCELACAAGGSAVWPVRCFGKLFATWSGDWRRSAAVSAILWALISRRAASAGCGLMPAAAVLVTVVDLAIAQSWLMPYWPPAEQWTFEPTVVQSIRSNGGGGRVFRESGWLPPAWQQSSAADRQLVAMRWDCETLWPKYHLAYQISEVEASGTLAPFDYQVLLEVARARRALGGGKGAACVGARFAGRTRGHCACEPRRCGWPTSRDGRGRGDGL